MSSIEDRHLQRRLDVRAETSSFEARPAFLWSFQRRKKQLQDIFIQRSSILHATAQQGHALGLLFGAQQRQSLRTGSRLSVTLAVRLLGFRRVCAATLPLKQATCVLSRRHRLRGRLEAVTPADAGMLHVIGRQGEGNGQFHQPFGGVAFNGECNLVVSDCFSNRFQVFL